MDEFVDFVNKKKKPCINDDAGFSSSLDFILTEDLITKALPEELN
jgi:hypothetical protein